MLLVASSYPRVSPSSLPLPPPLPPKVASLLSLPPSLSLELAALQRAGGLLPLCLLTLYLLPLCRV